MKLQNSVADLLGQPTSYESYYNPTLLMPIPRGIKRSEIGIVSSLPFAGVDIWNAYEISWLDSRGKPQIAIGEFHIPAVSPNLIESKSLKLYLGSFNQTCFDGLQHVTATLVNDLSRVAQAYVTVKLFTPQLFSELKNVNKCSSVCLDELPITTDSYSINPTFLMTQDTLLEEKLFSHLLRSNCPITNQPDWGSVWIHYIGRQIEHEGLLKYLISFREHQEFHEQCVERIFVDILRYCRPEKLTVYARYMRRGGLDINPFRSNFAAAPENTRTFRQ
ncbi:MAG: NADPH-dependent 7-cyano-7-deazaguanine reductase QueF [Gammaproteobacteria bacterium]